MKNIDELDILNETEIKELKTKLTEFKTSEENKVSFTIGGYNIIFDKERGEGRIRKALHLKGSPTTCAEPILFSFCF